MADTYLIRIHFDRVRQNFEQAEKNRGPWSRSGSGFAKAGWLRGLTAGLPREFRSTYSTRLSTRSFAKLDKLIPEVPIDSILLQRLQPREDLLILLPLGPCLLRVLIHPFLG
jgi:hypothetical protein